MTQWSSEHGSLDLATVRQLYRSRRLTPHDLIAILFNRIRASTHPNVFINLLDEAVVQEKITAMQQRARDAALTALPLYGIPFVVKDNIDVAGIPTTAACRRFSYTPETSAPVIQKLEAAGAVLLGKTNLDQFATGLTGVVSDFGPTRNPFNPDYISGGSSSGSAVAVAAGFASFSLGTDTAGSGRIPAAFNNLVGLKPSRGLVSARGAARVPLPRLHCLLCQQHRRRRRNPQSHQRLRHRRSLLAPRSQRPRSIAPSTPRQPFPLWYPSSRSASVLRRFRRREPLQSCRRASRIHRRPPGGNRCRAFFQYRQASVRRSLGRGARRLHRKIVRRRPPSHRPRDPQHSLAAQNHSAVSVFKSFYRLQELRRHCEAQWALMDALVLPTAGTIFRLDEALADPAATSAKLGLYTNFVNLLDLSAIALPAGFRPDRIPFGITLIAPAFNEPNAIAIAQRFARNRYGGILGAAVHEELASQLSEDSSTPPSPVSDNARTNICVVGAHLAGQPLNYQLTELDGTLLRQCKTAPHYRLYALPNTVPPKPGLAKAAAGGAAIDVEVWSIPTTSVGAFLAKVPPPLCIGTITLDTGEPVKGFLCEPHALTHATDISEFIGWRSYLNHRATAKQQSGTV